jgi:hypothetical protein
MKVPEKIGYHIDLVVAAKRHRQIMLLPQFPAGCEYQNSGAINQDFS